MSEIISKFNEKPKTKLAWWSMWLGLSTIIIGRIVGSFISYLRPIIDESVNYNIRVLFEISLGLVINIYIFFVFIICIRAFKKGERSWVLWVGFIPAIFALITLFFTIISIIKVLSGGG